MLFSVSIFLAFSSAYLVPSGKRLEQELSAPSGSENNPKSFGSGEIVANLTSPAENRTDVLNSYQNGTNSTTPVGIESNTTESYIVVLKPGHDDATYEAYDDRILEQFTQLKKRSLGENTTEGHGVDLFNVSSFHGFAAEIPPDMLATIQADPLVDFVEKDSVIEAAELVTQDDAPWGLARVSHRSVSSPPAKDYRYDSEGGKGVTVYVLDTGIQTTNQEFQGRASPGISIEEPSVSTDLNGHGTRVAGIIGSRSYGMAKQVEMVSVGVLDRNKRGSVSSFIKGVEYAVRDHRRKIRSRRAGYKGAVINMSVSSQDQSRAHELAVEAAIAAGLHAVVAAGNSNQDACNFSPAKVGAAITVGSIDNSDRKAPTSNFGRCVDIQAPGIDISSVGLTQSPSVGSGTSLATPHVSGLVAYLISLQPDRGSGPLGKRVISPRELTEILMRLAVKGVVKDLTPGTPNVMAYNGARG